MSNKESIRSKEFGFEESMKKICKETQVEKQGHRKWSVHSTKSPKIYARQKVSLGTQWGPTCYPSNARLRLPREHTTPRRELRPETVHLSQSPEGGKEKKSLTTNGAIKLKGRLGTVSRPETLCPTPYVGMGRSRDGDRAKAPEGGKNLVE